MSADYLHACLSLLGIPNTRVALIWFLTDSMLLFSYRTRRTSGSVESKKMTTASKATEATTAKVIAPLVKAYEALVESNDSGIRDWWRKASDAPVRDLANTIKEAQKKFPAIRGIKPAYANNARLAVQAFDIKGADAVPVTEVMKVVEKAQRALKIDGALVLVGQVKDFADFEAKVESVQKPKKARAPKAGKAPAIAGEITASAIVSMAFGLWRELEDCTLDNAQAIAEAEQFSKTLAQAVAYSKGELAKSKKAHPVSA